MEFDHLQREAGGDGGIEGIAALFEDRHAGRGREPMGRGDDAEGAEDLGAGGEGLHRDLLSCRP
jgi:hypothetical protein